MKLLAKDENLDPKFEDCRGPFFLKELVPGPLFKLSLNRVQSAPDAEKIRLGDKSPGTKSGNKARTVDLYRATVCVSPSASLNQAIPMLIETYVLAGEESIVTGDDLNINPPPTADTECRLGESSTAQGRESSFLFELPRWHKLDKVVFGFIAYDDLLLFQTEKPPRVTD